MRWLITGAGGMLGRDVVEELTRRGETVVGLDRAALDITSPRPSTPLCGSTAPTWS